jgi:hypothetical protein
MEAKETDHTPNAVKMTVYSEPCAEMHKDDVRKLQQSSKEMRQQEKRNPTKGRREGARKP